jgi:hypothetical protein
MAKSSVLISTFPRAALLLPPREHGNTVSGVLVARDSGYLAVQVQFHGESVSDVEVRFFHAVDDERGDAVGDAVKTDEDGIARALRVVPAGLYVCAVENQDDTVVPTVAEYEDAYPVVLPVGRSYVDMHDGPEFTADDAKDGVDAAEADEDGSDTGDAAQGENAAGENDADKDGQASDQGGLWE